jgi:two-component system NtrC family response regulator
MDKPLPAKQRILLTFVGTHDPYRGESAASGDGPVLSLLQAQDFDGVHIFYNNGDYLRRASAVLTEVNRRWPKIIVAYEEICATDPTNYDLLYELMHNRCCDIAQHYGKSANFTVATSSGTPQMQTCWLLLVLGGVFNARLVQLAPPHKLRAGESPIREIKPSLERFPRIVSPPKLQRELSAAKHLVEVLTREREAIAREVAPGLVGEHPTFRRAVKLAKQVAAYNVPILITGETGTGKEEFAKLVHFSSPRAQHPFFPVNCAGISESLAESELFGHVAGAFTGATKSKLGIFELAGDGSVFLDEIGELPLPIQAKLLRVLEDGSFMAVGSGKHKKSAARIIAATNRDLNAMVAEGKFRDDLLYRLNTAEIQIPPLRDRKEDVPTLAQRFLDGFCSAYGKTLSFDSRALAMLQNYEWPGNVRALKHVVERLAIACSGKTITVTDLVLPKKNPSKTISAEGPIANVGDAPINLSQVIEDWEKDMMEQAIARFQGNRSAAARHLGYEEPTFRKKCREYFGSKT